MGVTPVASIRVGIVDDHRLVLDGVSAHLRFSHPDLQVVAAETTWVGLLQHPDFPVDVAVLDLGLGDDIPVETKIRTLATAGTRTVVMSRHADAISVQSALQAGAYGFVPKAEGATGLVQAIRAAAAGVPYRANSMASLDVDSLNRTTPGLGRQELRALMLFATGRPVREVAEAMETTEETVKSYLKRARRKYRAIGVDLGTKALLRRHAVREGWIGPE
ncbi:response regulator transcription factor [Salinibacterium sp. dk2585]|uniref:response regulator transcription factor n=1 Tax=unclassified Salinibacterium TaxID=2632331 RepID=UPI0011C24C5C|nr:MULTISPECIES: response regulator transcription factor [unclassified Salinibacterium]QEE61795.1 response regulator transcription factor [Salinibacterium sp. dk2585]TXK54650.1 response regulator transcription factor [Salinibacterium sp. dk5596]